MIMLVPTAFEWFEEWQEEPKGKRGGDYETFKGTFVEACMAVVMRLFPHLEGKVGRGSVLQPRGPAFCSHFCLVLRPGKQGLGITKLRESQGAHPFRSHLLIEESRTCHLSSWLHCCLPRWTA